MKGHVNLHLSELQNGAANCTGSVMQTFYNKSLNSAEHTSAQETGWLEEKLKTFISCKGSSVKEVFSLLGICVSL